MPCFLTKLSVDSFRGIRNLCIDDIGEINILVGENNSGKTSILEAIMLLRDPHSFSNVLRVARLRELRRGFYPVMGIYEAFIYLFERGSQQKDMLLRIKGETNFAPLSLTLFGTIENIMVDPEVITNTSHGFRRRKSYQQKFIDLEVPVFIGTQHSILGTDEKNKQVEFGVYHHLDGFRVISSSVVDIVYVSPTEHVSGSIFNEIIKNDYYKETVIKILQTYDEDITDLLLLRDEQSKIHVENIKHSKLGIMPLSTYGDGIKKAILLADRIAKAQNGILLLDEIETAIHVKAFNDVFSFVVKACKDFNVQLFATTHSIEVVDSILTTQCVDESLEYQVEKKDPIRIITFRKSEKTGATSSRVLTGEQVHKYRENIDFEVRM